MPHSVILWLGGTLVFLALLRYPWKFKKYDLLSLTLAVTLQFVAMHYFATQRGIDAALFWICQILVFIGPFTLSLAKGGLRYICVR